MAVFFRAAKVRFFTTSPFVTFWQNHSRENLARILHYFPPSTKKTVLVKPAEAEQKTAGGIIIPDTAKEKPQQGTVIAVGPGKKDEPMTVKVKDTVLYGKYSGTEIQLDGETYLIMKESDIYAICK